MSRFQEVAKEIGDLVTEKNAAYGDSFGQSGKILAILYPNGVKLEQYDDFLAITRIVDKLFRIATKKDAFGESPWKDICGYGLNAASRLPAEKSEPEKQYVIHVSTVGRDKYVGYMEYRYNGQFYFFPEVVTTGTTRFPSKAAAEAVVAECQSLHGTYYSYTIEEA